MSSTKKLKAFIIFGLFLTGRLPLTLSRETEEVSREGQRRFADSLTNELYENDNECSSSLGVSLMFDLLHPGGTAKTRDEMCTVLALCNSPAKNGSSTLHWKDTVSRLTAEYDGWCVSGRKKKCFVRAPTVEIASSVWVPIDLGLNLSPEYESIVGEFLQETKFTSPKAGVVVNEWVNASTRGLIDSIVDDGPIYPPFVLLALNSIYLKANWQSPFKERLTNADKFFMNPSRTEELPDPVNFMHQVEFFPYSHDAITGYQIIQLKYAASSLSMVVVLPTDDGLDALTSEDVLESIPFLDSQRVALALPRFRFESKYKGSLKKALKRIGLVAPFRLRNGGGFCGIFSDGCEWLELIIQKTLIEVNEIGTIAAAVTLGALAKTGVRPIADVPVLFMADHSFQFFLYDSMEDLVLFEGRVGSPEMIDGSAPAQLQAIHADANFWTANFRVDPELPPRGFVEPTSLYRGYVDSTFP